jgi:hypothetical protein
VTISEQARRLIQLLILKHKAPELPSGAFEKILSGILASPTLAAIAASTAAAAVAAATTTVAAAATATIAAATIAATTAAASGWTRFARTRFVDSKRPAFNRFAVELGDRFLCIGLVRHGDEGEAARLAGEFVLHEGNFINCADLSEEILEFRFSGIEGKISYV